MVKKDFANLPIYTSTDVPYFEYLRTFTDHLRNDFLKEHPSYTDINKSIEGLELIDFSDRYLVNASDNLMSDPKAWKVAWLSYKENYDDPSYIHEDRLQKYPTVTKLIKKLKPILGIVMYSSMESHSVIERHTDNENRENKFLRIQIPLIIPKGDVFLEVNGEEADYSDMFGFNNQYVHSAHNYTKDRRLVFIIDIRRAFLGMPPANCYDPEAEKNATPFLRNGVIWDSNAELARLKAL
jgi:hypothetical protein